MGFFLPALLGILVVLQAGVNRKVAALCGLPAAVFLNAVVLTLSAGIFLALTAARSQWFPPEFRWSVDTKTVSPWFFFPGLIGFVLVLGGPWAISRWGALHTFILLISAQLLTSLVWDLTVEGLAVSRTRWAG